MTITIESIPRGARKLKELLVVIPLLVALVSFALQVALVDRAGMLGVSLELALSMVAITSGHILLSGVSSWRKVVLFGLGVGYLSLLNLSLISYAKQFALGWFFGA